MSTKRRHHEEEFAGRLDFRAWRRIVIAIWELRVWLFGFLGSAAALGGVEAAMPWVMGHVFDALRDAPELRVVLVWAAAYGVLTLLMGGFIFTLIYAAGRVSTAVAFKIRELGFARLQELPVAYHDERSVGWLVSRLTTDCEKVANTALWFCCDVTWGLCLVIFSGLAMLWMRWSLALVILGVLPLLAWVTRLFQVRMLGASRDLSRYGSIVTGRHTENINGVRTTKVLTREAENLEDFEGVNRLLKGAAIRHGVLSAAYMPIVWGLGGLGVAAALYLGGVTSLKGNMTLGQWVAFMNYAVLMVIPVVDIARQVAELQRAQAAAERIASLLDTEPEIRDTPEVQARIREARAQGAGPAGDGLEEQVEQIAFRDVTFAYVEERPVLRQINLEAAKGQSVALVGPTGGGKSTLVQLACRFYEPQQGQVLINGRDYRERGLKWLQSRLGFVLQEPQLFSGSIADNIRYGRLDATDEEVCAAACTVHADAFIRELADGYATAVGEGGVRLSSGQRQLISFARAVLADPQIFVMDEATSAVDSETERLIQKAMHRVLAGRISFVIAHRLSTIRHASQVLFVEGGRIVERGTHSELMHQRGRYYQLYSSQYQRETIDRWDGAAARPAGVSHR